MASSSTSGSPQSQHQGPANHPNLHMIPSVVSFIQIHREFIVAGIRSPTLVQAILKQLPASMKNSVEDFSVQLREKIAAAGTIHGATAGPSSSSAMMGASLPTDDGLRGGGLKSPTRSFIFGNSSSISASPNSYHQQSRYTPEQQEHLARFKVALIGAPDRRCDPTTEDDILPSPMVFGLSQGDTRRLRQFLAMPCNGDLVAFLHSKTGGGNNGNGGNSGDDNGGGGNSGGSGGGDGGLGGGSDNLLNMNTADLLMMGSGASHNMMLSSTFSGGGSGITEALQFAATMWIQRYPSDPAAQNVEQQRCRKAGVVFSHQDVVRMYQEEHTAIAKANQQEQLSNTNRTHEAKQQQQQQQQAPASGPIANDNNDDSDENSRSGTPTDGATPSPASPVGPFSSASATAILLPRNLMGMASPSSSPPGRRNGGQKLTLDAIANAAIKNQARLERQKRQLLLCNLRLHFPSEAPQWTLMLAARDECLHELADERAAMEVVAAELTAASSPLLSSFVKLIVLAENATNGLQHTNYNATPTDIADLLISKLSPILIEAKLLKATQLQNAATAIEGKCLDAIKLQLEEQITAEHEAARIAAKKKGPLSFFQSSAKKKAEEEAAAAARLAANNGVECSSLELSAAYHIEALSSVANKCLKTIQATQPQQPLSSSE